MTSTDATLSADFFIEEEEEIACTQPCEMCPEVNNCPKRLLRWSSRK